MSDRGPVVGREAIEKWHADLFKQFHLSNSLITVDENLHPAGLEPATLVTKLKLACARFGGRRLGLVLFRALEYKQPPSFSLRLSASF